MKEISLTERYPKTMCYVLERITENIRCNCCGNVVLKSDLKDYQFQCMFCDKDLIFCETHIGELRTAEELKEILRQTADILLLDEVKL